MSRRVLPSVVAVVIGTIGLTLAVAVGCAGGVTSPGVITDTTTQDTGDRGDVSYVLPAQIAADGLPA